MSKDIVFNLIEKEKRRQLEGIELIASENYVSPDVLKAAGSVLTNKYAEGYPGKRYYGGCEVVDEIEQLAIDRCKELFGAAYANVQPHSGSQANAAVYLACLNAGDTVLGFDLSHGGHLTHGSTVNFSGIIYNSIFYGVDKESGQIDYDHLRERALKAKPKMIICGASAYSRDINYTLFRKIADEVGAILMADISHPAGLIAKKLLNDPLKHCHIVTSTTHKTLRGPRGGIIMMGEDFPNPFGEKLKNGEPKMMSRLLDGGVFPGTQGGPLEHIIAAKAVAFQEALDDRFESYAKQVISNSKALCQALLDKSYIVISGGTDNHLLLIDLRNKNISGKDAETALGKVDITVNKNMVPFDDKSPFITSGIRLGTAAMTTRGLNEQDMVRIAELIDEAIENFHDENKLASLKSEVNEWVSSKPLFV